MERVDLLKRIKIGIASKDPLAEVFLFGSRARGDNRKDSDWDILVLSPREKITFDYEKDLHDPIFDVELESGEVITLLVYSKSDFQHKNSVSPLFKNVLNEGIRI
jgi:predicted nucleotidyltransferase